MLALKPVAERLPNEKGSLLLAFFAIATISQGLKFVHTTSERLPEPLKKAGATQFLTNLSAHFTVYYFVLSILANLTKNVSLYRVKNNLLLPVAISVEIVVTFIYWGLRLFVPSLILMKQKDGTTNIRLPFYLDLCLHLVPLLTLLLDYLLYLPQFEISKLLAFFLSLMLAVGYWLWLDHLIDPTQNQAYPYPFLNVETKQRAVIFLGVSFMAFSGFLVVYKMYDLLVPTQIKKKIDNAVDSVEEEVAKEYTGIKKSISKKM